MKVVYITLFSMCNLFTVAKKDLFVRVNVQEFPGTTCSYRVDIIDGRVQERWEVNGRQVAESEYVGALEQAERDERQRARQVQTEVYKKQHAELAQKQEFERQVVLDINKKRLQLIIDQVEKEIARLQVSLTPYHAYGKDTFDTAGFEALVRERVPQAKQAVALATDLEKTIAELEPMIERVRAFYRATVKNAITKCDDTRQLKELLDTVCLSDE